MCMCRAGEQGPLIRADGMPGQHGPGSYLPHSCALDAGLAFKGNAFGAEEAQQTLDVNFFGTRRATEALLPIMSDEGRIVNVCRCVS